MKVLKYVFFLVTLGIGKADLITQARQELSSSPHIANPLSPAPSQRALFEQQSRAIETIGKYGNADDVELLIPYLDYPGPGFYIFSPSESGYESEKTSWPAFGAITRIPHSTEQLYAYALNKNNPIDYRLTVLDILQFVAPDSYIECVNKIKESESGNSKLLVYIQLIPAWRFHGMVHHEALDDWLKKVKMRNEQKAPSNP